MVQNNTDSNPEDAVDSYGPSRGELFAKVQARKPFSATDLSSSVPTNFSFPRDADAHADKVFGIDIFHASDDLCGKPDSCKLDWKIIADQKVSFVYVKASQGNNPLPDKDFVRHWQSLAKQRYVMRGAYHFMSATSRPEDGAKSFVDKVMKAGGFSPRDLPPAMDLEWDYQGKGDDQWSGQSPDKIIDKALVWLKYVKEKTGRTPMIYTSRAWWEEVRIDFKKIERLKDYPIWIADYALNDQKLETPKLPDKWTWKLWQFTACGGLPGAGINSKWNPKVKCVGAVESLDVSFYPGTLPDFRKTFEIMMPAANDRIAHANDIVVPIEDPKKRDGLADENVIVARLELPQRDGGIPDKLEEIANIEQSQTQVQTEADNGPAAPRIEIEFPNGRKLRADANVDPVILARLIKVIEGGAPTGDTP